MQIKMRCENPEDIVYSMTITMRARDWEDLKGQLSEKWPSWNLSLQISDLLMQARRVYCPKPVETKE